jgi:hypothetical protein
MAELTEAGGAMAYGCIGSKLPEAKAAIGRPVPMLMGEFSAQELEVAGGPGVRA